MRLKFEIHTRECAAAVALTYCFKTGRLTHEATPLVIVEGVRGNFVHDRRTSEL